MREMEENKSMSDKVLLIRPRNIYNYNNYPSLGLISLGTVLKSKGYDIKIINTAFRQDYLGDIEKELEDSLFAGVSLLTSEAPDAYRIIRHIKKVSDKPVVAGGVHCTLFPGQMMEDANIDYVIAGEGEKHIADVAELLKKGGKEPAYFKKERIDFDGALEPDYSVDSDIELFITSKLTDKLSEYVGTPMRWLPYESSRGCPSRCAFCINVVTDNRAYRPKRAGKVIHEIRNIVDRYGLTHLKIIDDNFFVDIKRAKEISKGIVSAGLNITWDAECRCDYFRQGMLDDDTLSLLRESGLVQLTLGIESGSKRTLELMKKDIVPEKAEHAVRKCDEHRIIARSSFMLEIPGERKQDIKETIRFINRLRKYKYFTCGVGTFRPYPRCELTRDLMEEGYLKEPESFFEWADKNVVDMYTSAEYIRPWQVDGRGSERASFYLNMESAVRVGPHQMIRKKDKVITYLFMFAARVRNRLMFYKFDLDKKLYKKFLEGFYKRQDIVFKRRYHEG